MSKIALMLSFVLMLTGCIQPTRIPSGKHEQTSGYKEPASPGGGIGIESQDIINPADKMVRDILTSPAIIKHPKKPRIVIDSANFKNRTSSRIDINALTNKLRVELQRAANDRVDILARHQTGMTEKEWMLEVSGMVSEGTQGETKQALGFDYRLGGEIVSIEDDGSDPKTGAQSRYYQITFELMERGSTVIVWSGIYEFKKTAQGD